MGWESPRDIFGRKSLPEISEIKINSSHGWTFSGTQLEHQARYYLNRPESHNSACFSLLLRPITIQFFIELKLSVLGNAGFSTHQD